MKKLLSQAQENAAMTNATIVAGHRPDPHRVHDSQQVSQPPRRLSTAADADHAHPAAHRAAERGVRCWSGTQMTRVCRAARCAPASGSQTCLAISFLLSSPTSPHKYSLRLGAVNVRFCRIGHV